MLIILKYDRKVVQRSKGQELTEINEILFFLIKYKISL